MHELLEEKRVLLEALCRRYHVAKLELFGSAAKGAFDSSSSDLDFLVEFQRVQDMNLADQYFGLLDDLGRIFDRQIDLLTPGAVRNPYLRKAINETRQLVYAA